MEYEARPQSIPDRPFNRVEIVTVWNGFVVDIRNVHGQHHFVVQDHGDGKSAINELLDLIKSAWQSGYEKLRQ